MSSRILGILLALLPACATVRAEAPPTPQAVLTPAELVDWLSPQLGLDLPVRVVWAPILQDGYYGQTWFWPHEYEVVLEGSLDAHAQLMVLVHELAHIVCWERGHREGDHGAEWSLAYGEVFRLAVGEVQDPVDSSSSP